MGLKLSCIHRRGPSQQVRHQPTPQEAPARVIAADGSLKELPASPAVAVSDVLGIVHETAPASFFVCNSDALYFNAPPPALSPGELLRPGQIYFVLPVATLRHPLSSADMAGLAVRASAALAAAAGAKAPKRGARRGGGGGDKRKRKVRVVPVHEEQWYGGADDVLLNEKLNEQTLGEFAVMSLGPAVSDGKLAAAAERARLKRALSMIQEDVE